jgi:hypothetical protein
MIATENISIRAAKRRAHACAARAAFRVEVEVFVSTGQEIPILLGPSGAGRRNGAGLQRGRKLIPHSPVEIMGYI